MPTPLARFRPLLFALATTLAVVVVAAPPAAADAPATQPGLVTPTLAPLPADDAVISRIALGSCANQTRPQPIWDEIAEQDPQLFLFIGDNMYADLDRRHREIVIDDIYAAYAGLAALPPFQRFAAQVPFLATWDDHDFGLNDAGAELSFKAGAREALLAFWNVADDSPRWGHDGVYGAYAFGPEGKRLQVILLDTRYGRGPVARNPQGRVDGKGPYVAHDPATEPAFLSEDQWAWLEEQLQKPADLRLIASSVQVVADEHGWETWGNFPRERRRLFRLIEETAAEGVFFISGDRHLTELSIDDSLGPYPAVDLTSSGINQGNGRPVDEPNTHRIAGPFRTPHYSRVDIDWDADPAPTLRLRSVGLGGETLFDHTVSTADLTFAE